jgi:hypothetical protein
MRLRYMSRNQEKDNGGDPSFLIGMGRTVTMVKIKTFFPDNQGIRLFRYIETLSKFAVRVSAVISQNA